MLERIQALRAAGSGARTIARQLNEQRVKNPRARSFKLLAVEAASDNLAWDDEDVVEEVAFDPTAE